MGWYRGGDAGGRGDIKLISRPQACFDYGERQPAPARQSSYAALPLALLAQPKAKLRNTTTIFLHLHHLFFRLRCFTLLLC